jgi:hypothetical protein
MIPITPAAGRTPAEKAAKCTYRDAVWQLLRCIRRENGEAFLFHAFQRLRERHGARLPLNLQTQLRYAIG